MLPRNRACKASWSYGQTRRCQRVISVSRTPQTPSSRGRVRVVIIFQRRESRLRRQNRSPRPPYLSYRYALVGYRAMKYTRREQGLKIRRARARNRFKPVRVYVVGISSLYPIMSLYLHIILLISKRKKNGVYVNHRVWSLHVIIDVVPYFEGVTFRSPDVDKFSFIQLFKSKSLKY